MIKTLFTTIAISLITICLFAQKADIKRIEDNIKTLASDGFRGRAPGTAGGKMAAEHILQEFLKAGITPLYENGFQYFDIITSVEAGNKNRFTIGTDEAILEKDFSPLGYSENGILNAEIVFVGYGFEIDCNTMQWNDYEDIDLAGKWALILRGDPDIENPFSNYLNHSDDRNKVLIAKDHGAKGVLLVSGKKYLKEDNLVSISYEKASGTAGIPVINITRDFCNTYIFEDNTVTGYEDTLNSSLESNSFKTGILLSANVDLIFNTLNTQNVVGMLKGKDSLLNNQYLVIGAHYDHLGMGGKGTTTRKRDTIAVHNGADDNASGVAGIIELANLYKQFPTRRSIIFVAFGAEEIGLIGSKYFVNNTEIELTNIKSMINFDMIGRMDSVSHSLTISGTGTSREANSILKFHSVNYDFIIKQNPGGYGPSDHSSFYINKIPVLFFSTGTHEDYHTPEDDFEKLNIQGEANIINLAYEIITDIANRQEFLTYSTTSGRPQLRGSRKLKVTLGIIPDFEANSTKGLDVDGVSDGGPAQSAGMHKGDLIVSLNGQEISNIYDYMYRLAKLKPGETVIVEVIRNNEKKVLLIQL